MLQEPQAKPLAPVCPFDDAGDVGHHEGAVVGEAHDAEVRLERSERILGDLGPRRGHHGEQRALAHVRLSEQPHVGDQLEHELQLALLPVFARLPLPGALVRRGRETGVAASAAPATRHQQHIVRPHQLAQQRPRGGVAHLGAGRHRQVEVCARLASHVLPFPVLPPLSLPVGAVAVIK